jgi:hypothetical protein
MPKIRVTPLTHQWLKSKVDKTFRRFQALPENVARKQEAIIKHWEWIDKKFKAEAKPEPTDGKIVMNLKRVELKSLQNVMLEAIVVLTGKIIPEYESRIEKIPAKAEHYNAYVHKSRQLVQDLNEMLGEIQNAIQGAP